MCAGDDERSDSVAVAYGGGAGAARVPFAWSTPTSRRPMIGYGIPRAC